MTDAEIFGYTKRLGEILKLPPSEQRDQRLTNFMSDLKEAYDIPSGVDQMRDFEWRHSSVMIFYRCAEDAMTFERG
ncbi:hypothetical protein P4641_08680 [Halalkalibacterium halodurans]|uniref:hypothetical protein n=1 Tax=Halalkalibacterium halodurans TaxID=86665 RepID=UPI002E1E5C3E|nr:hypothetical protein [Halalkalibacterium halodurans]